MTRRCEVCGEDKAVPDEIRPKGTKCADCRKRLRKEYERRYNAEHREHKLAYSRAYYEANREQVRANQRMWYRANAEQHKARAKAWKEAHVEERREYMREWHRRWWADLKADPERYADYLERKRIEDRLRAERNGKPMAPATGRGLGWKPSVVTTHQKPMLDVGPLRDFLIHEFSNEPTRDLARRFGIDDTGLRRIMAGDYARVSLHIADRIFTRADAPHMLAVLYPLDAA